MNGEDGILKKKGLREEYLTTDSDMLENLDLCEGNNGTADKFLNYYYYYHYYYYSQSYIYIVVLFLLLCALSDHFGS
jgi:hypothetical protein